MRQGTDLIRNGEIILSGMIVSDMEAGWYYGENAPVICPAMVRDALAAVNGTVTVRLSSDGGDPFAGEAIRSMIATHPGGVDMIVEGIAASAASLIFMGAARRIMTAASFIMIHDPSSLVFGNEADMLVEAGRLGQLSDTYAAVYGRAAGMTADQARKIMKAETYLNADEAIALGFAHEVLAEQVPGEVATLAMSLGAAQAAFSRMVGTRRAMIAQHNSGLPQGQPQPTAAAGGVMAISAATLESDMNVANPAAAAATTNPVVMAVPDANAIAAAALANGRSVRMMAQPFIASGMLTQADVDAEIDAGTPAADAGQRFMAMMAAAQPAVTRPAQVATIQRDEVDTKIEGMIGALMGDFKGPGSDYRGLRLKSLAMHLAGPKRGFEDILSVRAGMMATTLMSGAVGVSDFAFITTSVMNRTLQAEYNRRAASWQAVSGAPLSASDFRDLASVRFGGDFQLKKILANGEYQSATLKDEASSLRVERFGRELTLTFEAVINDDMGALSRIPMEFALAARILENSMVWSLFRANAVMSVDGVALFAAAHGNLAAVNAAITVASVGLGRKAMWEQRAVGGKDKDDFLQIEPNRLIFPPALETAALQFVTATVPNSDGSVNPFKASLTAITVANLGLSASGSDTSWYLVSSDLPPISVAYLDGYAAPNVQTIEGMNPDAIKMNARHIFGAAAMEFRGAYKNNGL